MYIRRRFQHFGDKFPTLRNISTLLTGTVIAQLIVLSSTPIISRLYSPEEIGSATALLALVQIIAPVAAFRYDMAIVLPKDDRDARGLLTLALILATVVSAVASAFCFFSSEAIAQAIHHPELRPFMVLIGFFILCTATTNSFNYWFTRTLDYRIISANRVQQIFTIETLKILSSTGGVSAIPAQIFSQLFGQVSATITLAFQLKKNRRYSPKEEQSTSTPKRDILFLLKRYIRMPLITTPNTLIDALRINGIIVLIGIFFSSDEQGQFAKAWLLTQAPVSLITSSVSQVYFQKFSHIQPGSMKSLMNRSVKLSIIAAIVPFSLLFFIAPIAFPWYLGTGWEMSGQIAQALVPWMLLNVITSPISTIFIVTERQMLMLIFSIAYMLAPLSLIAFLGTRSVPLLNVMWTVSLVMTLLLSFLVGLTAHVAKHWDATTHPEPRNLHDN